MTNPTNANAPRAGEANAESADFGELQGERSTVKSSMREVAYSRGATKYDNTPAQRIAPDFAAFRDAILADRAHAKGQQYIAAPCAPDPALDGQPHRNKACALPRRFVGLDVDGSTPEAFAAAVLHLQRYSGLIYTTASHTPAAPRFRVVLELDMPAPRAELIAASSAIRARIDAALAEDGHAALPWDASCDRPEQPLYLPLAGAQAYVMDGVPLALGELLADVPAKPAQDAPQAPRVASVAEPTAWALGALESACRAVASAPEGDRNNVLNREAYSMGGFVAAGQLSAAVVEAALFDATQRAGYATPDADRRKIAEGIRAGMTMPRTDGLPAAANDAPASSRLVEVALADVMLAKPTAPRFVIIPIIPRNVATLLGGHGGLGKSMLGLTLCAHVGAGRRWGPFAVEKGRAVFVSLEDPGDLVRYRLRCIIDEYQLPAHEVLANLRVFDGADVDAALVAESRAAGVVELVERPMLHEVATAATGAGLLVIDNASDAYGADENARAQVRAFMRRLSCLARANDGGLVLLAHVDKGAAKHGAQGNSYSGSTAWHNSARSRLALVEEKGIVELRHEKANLSRRAEPVILTYATHGVPVPAAGGGSRDAAEAVLAGADADATLAALEVAWAAGLTVPAAISGPNTGWHVLSKLPELPTQYRGTGEGKRRILQALVKLQCDGLVIRECYRNANRHDAWRLTRAVDMEARAA